MRPWSVLRHRGDGDWQLAFEGPADAAFDEYESHRLAETRGRVALLDPNGRTIRRGWNPRVEGRIPLQMVARDDS
jgi:hypothetical protein